MVFPRRSPSSPSGAAAGSGDDYDSAFADEALSYIDGLYGTALRLTRRPQDAEDLVQDTYLKAFRASKQFERGTNLKAWLFTILHNTFRNKIRHDGRNPVDVNSETDATASPAASASRTSATIHIFVFRNSHRSRLPPETCSSLAVSGKGSVAGRGGSDRVV